MPTEVSVIYPSRCLHMLIQDVIDQPVKLNKPEQVRLPMSGYMLDAERVVQVIKP